MAAIRLSLIVLVLVTASVLGPAAASARTARSAIGIRAVGFARHFLGVPYRWGGDSPSSGFDCSGFVRYVYGHFGFHLPHSTYADYTLGVQVSRADLRPGDLVFFDGVGHVGLYVGAGRFIDAPHTGASVQIARLDDPWYAATYDGARRLVPIPVRRPAHRITPVGRAAREAGAAARRAATLGVLAH